MASSIKPDQLHEELGLTGYCPGKITPQIARENIRYEVKTKADLPWYFIAQVLELSYRKENYAKYWEKLAKKTDENEEEEGDNEGWADKPKTPAFSFQDFFVAVFMCCNDPCKRLLSQKLQKCHIGVPLLLPDIDRKDSFILQHWALRGVLDEIYGFSTKAPIVAFVPLDGMYNHTKLLNKLVINGEFDTFLDRKEEKMRLTDLDLRKISWPKVVDVACFKKNVCTECKDNPYKCKMTFAEILTFLNVNEVYKENNPQSKLVCEISDLVVAFAECKYFDEDKIDSILAKSKKVLLVLTNEDSLEKESCKEVVTNAKYTDVSKAILFNKKDGTPQHMDNSKSEVRKSINTLIGELHDDEWKPLGYIFKNFKTPGIQLDISLNREAKAESEEICARVKELDAREDNSNFKQIMIPLQKYTWHCWSIKEKEKLVKKPDGGESYEEFQNRLSKDQEDIRKEQVKQFNDQSNKAMQIFCSHLTGLNGTTRECLIERLAIFLDERQNKVHDLRRKLQEESKTKVSEIEELEEKIENTSFDIMHFFRELGQVYEAFKGHEEALRGDFTVSDLSMAAASLFLNGYPLELVDCHARQIPLTFIESVFSDAKKKLNGTDGEIFILSVIGLQSSGKSTLLNTIFGTKFPTSVGLCTEGVNMQLVPVPSYYKNPGYKYIMVLDARGLRATDAKENAKARDNELATLLLGISDFTLINVQGEKKNEIKNILQIVTNALLDIMAANRHMQLKPKCMFVHHNVDAPDAKDKLSREEERFKKELDEVSVNKAKDLGLHKKITQFGDIIEFERSDIKYFPNLWKGTPPDATINKGYTRKVREVKEYIEKVICTKRKERLNLEMFPSKLKDIWTAIQSQEFVMNFVNQLEMNSWKVLEKHITELRYRLSDEGQNIIRKIKAKIESNPKVEYNCEEEIEDPMNKALEEITLEVNSFFENDPNGKFLIAEWQPKVQESLEELKDEKVNEVKKSLSSETTIQESKKEAAEVMRALEEEADQAMHNYIKEKKIVKELSDKEIENMFLDFWKPYDEKIIKNKTITPDKQNADDIIREALWDEGKLLSRKEVSDLKFNEREDFSILNDYFETTNKNNSVKQTKVSITSLTTTIIAEIELLMQEIKDEVFSKNHVDLTTKRVTDNFDRWNKENEDVCLTERYRKDMLERAICYAFPYFQEMQEIFWTKISNRDEIEGLKGNMWKRFRGTLKNINAVHTEANVFLSTFIKAIATKAMQEHIELLSEYVKENNPIMESKASLLKQIQVDLLNADVFKDYMSYIEDAPSFIEKSLCTYIAEYLTSEKRNLTKMLYDRATTMLDTLLNIVKDSGHEKYNGTFSWSKMIQGLSDVLPAVGSLDGGVIKGMSKDKSKMNTFYDYVIKYDKKKLLETLRQDLKEGKEKKGNENKMVKAIFEKLSDQLKGCQKQCPFCRVVCEFPYAAHEGLCYNTQHLPVGLLGFKLLPSSDRLAIGTCNQCITSSRMYRIEKSALRLPVGKRIWNFLFYGSTNAYEDVIYFKGYQTMHKDWEIRANKMASASLYWKRFFAKHLSELNKIYRVSSTHYPREWKSITEEEAIVSIG